jgi:hypothetical protein
MKLSDFPDQGRPGYVVVNASMVEDRRLPYTVGPDEYLIVRDCTFCGDPAVTVVPAQGLWDWEHGAFAQVAFPNLTATEREQVMTGTHGECWDRFMKEDDE